MINSDDEDAKASRYKSVSTSTLHTSWDHSILDLIRKEFQLALLARDGFPAKVSSLDREAIAGVGKEGARPTGVQKIQDSSGRRLPRHKQGVSCPSPLSSNLN